MENHTVDTTPSTVATNALQAIPFGHIIGGPLSACVDAQREAALTTVNFINEIPYGHDTILGPDNKITTFVVTLNSTGSEASVSFSRASMTEHASAEASDSSIQATKHEHTGIPPNETS